MQAVIIVSANVTLISIIKMELLNTTQLCDFTPGECVPHAVCEGKSQRCVCKAGYYSRGNLCRELINATICEGVPGECVTNARCVGDTCQCEDGYFPKDGL
ncbi:unnamed protein product, partial [Candidula unifasciata]